VTKTLLINGRITTLDPVYLTATAVAISDGIIAALVDLRERMAVAKAR